MTYRWTTNHDTPIDVDGSEGPQTIKAIQYGLDVTDDGVFGPVTSKAFQTWLGVTPDGVVGPVTIKALQKKLAVTQDGVWGGQTTENLQAGLNAGFVGSAPWFHGTTSSSGSGGGKSPISQGSVTFQRGQSLSLGESGTIKAACAAAGLTYSSGWESGYETICTRESSWNPNAVNGYDSNAVGAIQSDGYPFQCSRGLAQCIPQTFAAYHAAGTSNNIYDPVANIAASMLYVVHVYGVARDGSNLAANVQQADPNRPPKGY